MVRRMIEIEEEKCNGCGACAGACHEGAIAMIHGKAKLLRDDYCDGLGDCLPVCPTDAIHFVEREAAAYDARAVLKNKLVKEQQKKTLPCGCPGTEAGQIKRKEDTKASELMQWPVQMKLVPVKAPYYQDAKLLIAADCTAYAYGNFHQTFVKDHVTMIGCPKLDEGDYTEKLTQIFTENNIQSVTVVRMEVPCCGGIVHAVREALAASGKDILQRTVVLSADGSIL